MTQSFMRIIDVDRKRMFRRQVMRCGVPLMLLMAGVPASVRAGEPEPPQAPATADPKGTLEIYGFGQADAIVDFKQNNPSWYDVNRPSRLPELAGSVRCERPLLSQPAAEPPRRQGPRCRPRTAL